MTVKPSCVLHPLGELPPTLLFIPSVLSHVPLMVTCAFHISSMFEMLKILPLRPPVPKVLLSLFHNRDIQLNDQGGCSLTIMIPVELVLPCFTSLCFADNAVFCFLVFFFTN